MSNFRRQIFDLFLDFVMITLTIWLAIVLLLSACGFLAVLWYALSHAADIAACLPNSS